MMRYIFLPLLVGFILPHAVFAAEGRIFLDPKSGVYHAGDVIEVVVRADTDGERVSAVEGELAYNPKDFEVEEVTTGGSVLTTWSTPPYYDGESGHVSFSGWADTPYTGTDGVLLTLRMRALRPAQSAIVFNSGAMLSAQSRGSNILTTMVSGGYTISPKQEETPAPQLPQEPEKPQEETGTPPNQPASQETQTAALINSGFEMAPLIVVFLALLVLIAFCIAYVLHKRWI